MKHLKSNLTRWHLKVLILSLGFGLGLSNVQLSLVVAQSQSPVPSTSLEAPAVGVLSVEKGAVESGHSLGDSSQPISPVGNAESIVRLAPADSALILNGIEPTLSECGDQWIRTKQSVGERLVRVNACDEIWLVNGRDTEVKTNDDCGCETLTLVSGPLTCARLQNCRFVDSELSALTHAHASDPSKATLVYVHGNLTDLEYAKSRALQMYESIFNQPGCHRVPVRLVIYAWKSESELKRVVPDFKIKSARAYDIAPVFRSFLDQFPDRNLVLMGYSLGAQMILQSVFDDADRQKPGRYKVGLIVPSLEPRFLEGGEVSQISLLPYNELIESTDVYDNKHDRAIKIARMVLGTATRLIFARKNESPFRPFAAMADAEATCGEVAATPNRIRLIDITDESSRCHSIVKYSENSNSVKCGIRALVARATCHAQELARRPASPSSRILEGDPSPSVNAAAIASDVRKNIGHGD